MGRHRHEDRFSGAIFLRTWLACVDAHDAAGYVLFDVHLLFHRATEPANIPFEKINKIKNKQRSTQRPTKEHRNLPERVAKKQDQEGYVQKVGIVEGVVVTPAKPSH